MEKMLYNFLNEKTRHKLSDCQHGFRYRRSTFTLLLDYVDKLFYFNNKIEVFRCVFFDFKKAFDGISHNRLLFKLEKFDFDKKFVHLLVQFSLIASNMYLLAVSFHRRALFLMEFREGVF